MMRYISLFSGVGGFDLGFEQAGMECVAQVEFDKHASAVLAQHWPNVKRYEDVRYVGKRNLPPTDLICGGFPCTDVSVAGKRKGLAGERSGLWFEFHRIIAEIAPEWVVIENVPGLLSSNGGRDFAVIICGLVECGYRVAWRVLDSQYFGVPQRRRRVFIVGHLGAGRAAEILFERESSTGDFEPRREAGKGATAVTGTLSAGGAGTARPAGQKNEPDFLVPFRMLRSDEYKVADTSKTLAARDYKDATDLIVEAIDVRNLRSNGQVSGTLQAKSNGGWSLNYQNPIAYTWQSGSGFASGRNVSPALTANQHPAYGVRRLTPTECERLQGFPDGWTAGQSDAQRYKQMGNAVTVNVAHWIGERLMTNATQLEEAD